MLVSSSVCLYPLLAMFFSQTHIPVIVFFYHQ